NAQHYQAPFLPPNARFTAPDACGPGFYSPAPGGGYFGPNYYLRPPFPPFNGIPPGNGAGLGNGGGRQQRPPATFPSHPLAPPSPAAGAISSWGARPRRSC